MIINSYLPSLSKCNRSLSLSTTGALLRTSPLLSTSQYHHSISSSSAKTELQLRTSTATERQMLDDTRSTWSSSDKIKVKQLSSARLKSYNCRQLGIHDIPPIMRKSTFQSILFAKLFSSLPNSSDRNAIQVTTIPRNNNNGIINLIPLISESTLKTIRSLPEVEQAISSMQHINTISESNVSTLLDGLERATQIFQHIGEKEYKSILLLKATLQAQHCQYDNAIEVMRTLLDKLESEQRDKGNGSNHDKFIYMSNLTKIHWYNGSFDKGLEYAMIMNDIAPTIISSSQSDNILSSLHVYLRQGCAMNAKALCTLLSLDDKVHDVDVLQIKNKEDATNTIEPFSNASTLQQINDVSNTLKMASKMLSNAFDQLDNDAIQSSMKNRDYLTMESQLGLSAASSFCNQGIVDILQAFVRNQVHNKMSRMGGAINNRIPIDTAMNSWRKGINVIDDLLQNQLDVQHEYLAKALKAKLYCNMAWTILYTPTYNINVVAAIGDKKHQEQPKPLLKEDELKIASEYSSLALKTYDEIIELGIQNELGSNEALKPIMGRALGLVATCYAKAGSAVTAEGLLQSAMDLYKVNDTYGFQPKFCPLSQLDARSIYFTYASLCANWEKRDADAKKNYDIALEIDQQNLADNWQSVSAIYSGLSFFAVTDF